MPHAPAALRPRMASVTSHFFLSLFRRSRRSSAPMAGRSSRRYHYPMSFSASRSTPVVDALVSITARTAEDGMSAGRLGTERVGLGGRIRDDGLIATIGYVVNEAESVWLGTRDGATVPGVVLGYDFDSGFGLVRPTLPMSGSTIEIGAAATLSVGDDVLVLGSDANDLGLS